MADELAGRGDDEPRLGRTARLALVGLAAVTAGALLLALEPLGGASRAPAARETPTTSPSAESRTSEPAGPVPPGGLAVDALCPVQTDGERLLIVRFMLANRSGSPVEVDEVEPLLPLGGLRLRSVSTVSGDCHRWVPAAPGEEVIAPNGRRVVSMLFDLPRRCPHPFPVQARVRSTSGGVSATADLPVLADLTGTPFDACSSAPAATLPSG